MLYTRVALLGLIPAFALGFLSCVADPATEKEEDVAGDEATLVAADRASDIYGTYRALVIAPGGMPLLVLQTDGTYHRTITMLCPPTAPCTAAQDDGRFSLRPGDGVKYLFLYSDTGGVGRYEYTLQGDTIRLRDLDYRRFVSMTKTVDASWCAERDDCLLQHLRTPSCPGVWQCGVNVCNYACMAIPWEEPMPIEDPDPTETF